MLPPDIEIAQNAKLRPIQEIAEAVGAGADDLEPYGRFKAKLGWEFVRARVGKPRAKLILVTGMTPTRAGEGKTVTSIGLTQALNHIGQRAVVCLREPSLGPVFGIKGGAAGGAYSQVLPMEDINMHFTGDLHAITSAHNLLAAVADNHAHFETEVGLARDSIEFRRVVDLCDRQLRNVEIGRGPKADGFVHETGFDITAASEVMAILALSRDLDDLKERLGRIHVGRRGDGSPVFANELDCVGAMTVLLKEALLPNLVQTLEGGPALVHCGPFANIAHGCNSVLATQVGMATSDYAVTEAGFGADLGAEKFLHIKARALGTFPAAAVLVATVRAIAMHGGAEPDVARPIGRDVLEAGFANVRTHVENLKKFGLPVVVAINQFPQDTEEELALIEGWLENIGAAHARSKVAAEGGAGGQALAEAVVAAAAEGNRPLAPLYDLEQPLDAKIETLAREIYRADGVEWSDEARADLERITAEGGGELPVCVAKTQSSISDDPKLAGAPTGWTLKVRGLQLRRGAGFVIALTGKMLLMPGMPRVTGAARIGLDDDGRVFGLS